MRIRSFLTAICVASAAVSPSFAADEKMAESEKAKVDIVDTAVAAGDFTTLVALVQAAGLVETLKGEGPYTVFAPTDAAFEKVPAETKEYLMKPENKDALQAVLTYHVLAGNTKSGDIAGKTLDVETVSGVTLAIDATDGVKVGDATVVVADVHATNGVIHAIDTVLIPPQGDE